ncbi:MAG: LPS export ABC transporter permease LptG [Desulfobacterales bacterium]
MRVLYRYLAREIGKYFAVVLAAVLILFIAVDYLGTMDEFIESGISLLRALQYVLLKIPFMVVMFIPVGILLSVLVAFGLMARNRELVALMSGGVSVYQLIRPVLWMCVVSAAVLFFLSEAVAPITMARANRIQREEIRKTASLASTEKNIWIKGERMILYIRYYEPSKAAIYGVAINFFDDDFHLVRRIDAEKGVYRKGRWDFSEVLEQRRNQETGGYDIRRLASISVSIGVAPEDLRKVVKKSDEMGFRELREYIHRIEKEGYDATAYRVDLQAKIAFPFVCLIMGAVGVGIAANRKTGGNLPGALAIGIGAAFLYWILHSFCISLGRGEVLPPVVAAWAANFVFSCLGAVLVQGAA